MILLAVTACLFPLLYLTLELPKRIINDAIGAGSDIIPVFGIEVPQLSYLWGLCGAFLFAVLAHGLLKMRINTMKGVLAERLLRRFRFQLIARIVRFPQPYFERVSQGELVSMVTAESEPMGGLMGDAVSQPVLQAGQMATILYFLFSQSVWFGLAAVALIPLQGWLIPMLQRRINLLNKKRIHQVRMLASEIGETAIGAATLRANGGWRYRMARMTDRLGRLYNLRFEIYQKKFFMKFINNFITQLTPFFFYSVGGYLVLMGDVSLGALVAALAAYKDLASPWKELLTYYNQTQDMSLRWEIILERFAPAGMVDEDLLFGPADTETRLKGDILLKHVNVRDTDGNLVLEDLTATFQQGHTIAVTAPSEEDRRAFADVLMREVLPTNGMVSLGGRDVRDLHQSVLAACLGYASSRPVLFKGSFGENVMMPMRTAPLEAAPDKSALLDAQRAGNSEDSFEVDWIDPQLAGFTQKHELRAWWLQLIAGSGARDVLFRRGVDLEFQALDHPQLAEALIELRPKVRSAITEAGLAEFVYFNAPDRYNPALPVAENLLYASPRGDVSFEQLRQQTGFLSTIRRIGLEQDLLNLAQDVLDMLRQIFGIDGTDHPLFQKIGLDPRDFEAALTVLQKLRTQGADVLSKDELAQMLIVSFSVSAESIGPAFTDAMEERILSLRSSHGFELLSTLGDLFEPLSDDRFVPRFNVYENALFGQISDSAGARGEDIRRLIGEVLCKAGLGDAIVELIFDLPVAVGGQGLGASYAEPLAFCRATIKKPDILILNEPLKSFKASTRKLMQRNMRKLLPDTTIIFLQSEFSDTDSFDAVFELRHGRLLSDTPALQSETEDSAASIDLSRKLRALESTQLFSSLTRRQLRLLAFGARWYSADAGTVVFNKDDAASDGAYLIIDGDAGLYLPGEDGENRLITTVDAGMLVGELGLIRKEPRALTMVAESALTCLRIGEEEFLAVVENDAHTAFKLLQVVSGYVAR